jgi:hypothetical protein
LLGGETTAGRRWAIERGSAERSRAALPIGHGSIARSKFTLEYFAAAHDLRRTGVLVRTEGGKLLADGNRWGICEA